MIVGGHGGNLRVASEYFGFPEEEFLDFSANINPLGYPKIIEKLISENFYKLLSYPDIEYNNLINRLSEQLKLSPNNIIPGNGASELIELFVRTSNKKKAFITEPNFSEYRKVLLNNGILVQSIIGEKENNFKNFTQNLIDKTDEESILFLSSPNNPAGYVYSAAEIINLAEKLKTKRSLLFVDEAFIHFTKNAETVINMVDKFDNLFVLRSLTKILAVPGIRIGYLAGSSVNIKNIKLLQTPWSINCFAGLIGEEISSFQDFITETQKYLEKVKTSFYKNLQKINFVKVYQSQTNYFLCELDSKIEIEALEHFLGENKILIRSCRNYIGLDKNFIRVAVKKEEENEVLIKALQEYGNNI